MGFRANFEHERVQEDQGKFIKCISEDSYLPNLRGSSVRLTLISLQ
jgi:hypothetical protein